MPAIGRGIVVAFAIALLPAEGVFEPARFDSGGLPVQPPMTAGGGQVLLELAVDASGTVTEVKTLRSTPPFEDLLRDAVSRWQFTPAREPLEEVDELIPVTAKVLVAALFRPPSLYDAPAPGEVPRDVASPSGEIPFPVSMATPLYPPTAHWHLGQVALVEVEVGEDGNVTAAKVVSSGAGLDAVSVEAANRWKFRPAGRKGQPVRSFVYLVFGFREPVITP